MTAEQWTERLTKACIEAGTYRAEFEDTISTLADILARKDAVRQQMEEEDASTVVMHVNKIGAENMERHPLMMMLNEYSKTALRYYRELGLTPVSNSRIKGKNKQRTLNDWRTQ